MYRKNDDLIRSEILAAAERLFQRWGLNKTTMEEIAAEAGKGKSTLYYYFPGKEEIFDALLRRQVEILIARGREATLAAATAREKIKHYIIAMLIEIKNCAILYSIVRREIKGNQRFLIKVQAIFDERESSLIRTILQDGIRSQEFRFLREEELDEAARAMVGIIHALEYHFGLENEDPGLIDLTARMITHGL